MTTTIGGTTGITFPDATTQNTSPYTGGLAFRNRVINGAMVIDQRNGGASVTINASGNGYTLDRFFADNGSDAVLSYQQVSDAPAGFVNSMKITVTTADSSIAASQYSIVAQRIEGFNVADLNFGSANASPIAVSFWVKSSVTGSFGGSITNGAYNRGYPYSFTINAANTWERKTVTITGDTTGTWLTDNGNGMRMYFSLGAGTDNSGTANTWGAAGYMQPTGSVALISTLNATYQITGVQLEKGSTATSFDYRPYGTELALCQRYFNKITSDGTGDAGISVGGQANNTASFYGLCFPQMRAEPTAAASNINVTDWASYDVAATLSAITTGYSTAWLYVTHSSVGAAFRIGGLKTLTTGYVTLSAEL